jgi:hypothetical protein
VRGDELADFQVEAERALGTVLAFNDFLEDVKLARLLALECDAIRVSDVLTSAFGRLALRLEEFTA